MREEGSADGDDSSNDNVNRMAKVTVSEAMLALWLCCLHGEVVGVQERTISMANDVVEMVTGVMVMTSYW